MSHVTHPPSARPLRFVTAASLFDGHDASINIMRRILQAQGVEVVHLGHDRSVDEVIQAALEEDADGVAVSSYQGGHVEYFSYLVERLRDAGRADIRVFGGGGGTITDREIALLHERGVERIYSVEDGRRLGLVGMIADMVARAGRGADKGVYRVLEADDDPHRVARTISWLEAQWFQESQGAGDTLGAWRRRVTARSDVPVIGITGTGGAGKSSLTDELVRRALARWPERRIAVLSVDPTRRRTGGALLGDRIRMNAVFHPQVFMRSMATRAANASVSAALKDTLALLRSADHDLVLLETAGIGQSGSEVTELCDLSLYVMTPEFGAPSQLEKIDMLDFADVVAINKADKAGAEDALRHVRKQMWRNRQAFGVPVDEMPAMLCRASRYGDEGVDRVFTCLFGQVRERYGERWAPGEAPVRAARSMVVLPPQRVRYLSEIADTLRAYHSTTEQEVSAAERAQALARALDAMQAQGVEEVGALRELATAAWERLGAAAQGWIQEHEATLERYRGAENVYSVRGKEIRVENHHETLAGTRVPKVALPRTSNWDAIVRWRRAENLPGAFPFTAGVFPYKRAGEDPTRMFAGEGTPERTNRRFHFLSAGQEAARLSTAFDSVTLYGRDPGVRPDIYGKIGNAGVSVATLDDAKRLYSGFDLCAPTTSVSMTINGPAPAILAMFLNAAIDQAVERRLQETGRWEATLAQLEAGAARPSYRADQLPEGHNGLGLGLLGVSGDQLVSQEEYAEIRAAVLRQVRGTVQADILKEDQAQNTCIFSSDFALKMMGDIQAYFVDHRVQNFYSVSISGYHIAEAGANPITQLAFTLANGFTFVESYRSRGMSVDDFARNLSFFFSNGMDAEYAVIGRVARRIWAIALRDLYGADARSQQLKYHIQTSGRSLHAQEIAFNDIRTTLQAFYALADNCNSLHTNAYDEAITTPTEESVRRALAIQLILNREFGWLKNENLLQGSYVIEELTDLVEEAVLAEFDRLTERGGVLGAMELMYQRSKIQEESLLYEERKHSGALPIIGVNTFLGPETEGGVVEVEMARSSDAEKQQQIDGLAAFHAQHAAETPTALARLKQVAVEGGNVFSELMETVKVASLGQITQALFEVGGQYRRNM